MLKSSKGLLDFCIKDVKNVYVSNIKIEKDVVFYCLELTLCKNLKFSSIFQCCPSPNFSVGLWGHFVNFHVKIDVIKHMLSQQKFLELKFLFEFMYRFMFAVPQK